MLAGHHSSLLCILSLVARFKMDSEGSPGSILLSFERKLRGQASCNSQLGRRGWRRRVIAMSFKLEHKKAGRASSGSQQLLHGVTGYLQRNGDNVQNVRAGILRILASIQKLSFLNSNSE